MKTILALSLLAAVVAASTAAVASAAAAQSLPPCPGGWEIVRTDTIKPGKMTVFEKAVKDHQAWYTAHGLSDQILIGRVMLPPSGGAPTFSDTSALTIHTHADNVTGPAPHAPDDAAWNAYVAEYKASSDVVSTALVCVGGK